MGKYQVQSGDSWYKIAKRLNMDVNELFKLNNANANTMIHPGQQINTKSVDSKSDSKSDSKTTPKLESKSAKKKIFVGDLSTQQRKEIEALESKGYFKKSFLRNGSYTEEEIQEAYNKASKDGLKFNKYGVLEDPKKPKKPKLISRSQAQQEAAQRVATTMAVAGAKATGAKNAKNTETTENTPKGRAIYLHYPNFKGKASNALKIFGVDVGKEIMGDGNTLPVGHGETLLVDENGKVKYVRYGRYTTGTGVVRPTVKGGNWGIYDYPDMHQGETVDDYINRLLALNKKGGNYLEDSKYGAFEAIEIPNVDYQKALDYAVTQSNDSNRPEYSITNTCATGACKTIGAGLSTSDVLKTAIPTFGDSDADENIITSLWGQIPGTTNQYAQRMRNLGTSYIFNK